MRHSSVKFGRALKSTINNERIQKNVVTHGPFHFFHLGRKNSDAGVYHHPSIHHGAESKHFYLPSVIDNPFRVRGKPTRIVIVHYIKRKFCAAWTFIETFSVSLPILHADIGKKRTNLGRVQVRINLISKTKKNQKFLLFGVLIKEISKMDILNEYIPLDSNELDKDGKSTSRQ